MTVTVPKVFVLDFSQLILLAWVIAKGHLMLYDRGNGEAWTLEVAIQRNT